MEKIRQKNYMYETVFRSKCHYSLLPVVRYIFTSDRRSPLNLPLIFYNISCFENLSEDWAHEALLHNLEMH